MATKGFFHEIHGNKLHDNMRFFIMRRVVEKGGKPKDKRVFKDRACPCEPDAYFEIDTKKVSGNKRTRMKETYVAEVETKPSTKSRRKKYEQYKETLVGLTDLIVFDMNEEYKEFAEKLFGEEQYVSNNIYSDIYIMEKFVEAKLPI